MFKAESKPHKNYRKERKSSKFHALPPKPQNQITSPLLSKSESTLSNDAKTNKSNSLRIVLPFLNSGEINSIKPSHILMKKLFNTINS